MINLFSLYDKTRLRFNRLHGSENFVLGLMIEIDTAIAVNHTKASPRPFTNIASLRGTKQSLAKDIQWTVMICRT
jgi:hypothetical protein